MKKHSYESLIGEAIMATGDDRDLAMCRLSCKMWASEQMFCSCGSVLDQEDVIVIEADGKEVKAICSECLEKVRDLLIEKVYSGKVSISLISWSGRNGLELPNHIILARREEALALVGLKQEHLF